MKDMHVLFYKSNLRYVTHELLAALSLEHLFTGYYNCDVLLFIFQ